MIIKQRQSENTENTSLRRTPINRDKVSYDIINNQTKVGENNVEIARKRGKRTELGENGKKVMANPFIFSIGGVASD